MQCQKPTNKMTSPSCAILVQFSRVHRYQRQRQFPLTRILVLLMKHLRPPPHLLTTIQRDKQNRETSKSRLINEGNCSVV